ncbi:hypothetical protein XBJ1_2788 [Xenorhabdus bovienii SS-2004]|uniref:Uncharacterized protein n=1 Tax=Xenorhabdus bovienii (strain SS-2004) TaxID=406818 RepID=D3V7V0_XENBS|nr:hypothetical protein XBJ1_2788 [Xenorhabdus bovienii SS-2004]
MTIAGHHYLRIKGLADLHPKSWTLYFNLRGAFYEEEKIFSDIQAESGSALLITPRLRIQSNRITFRTAS